MKRIRYVIPCCCLLLLVIMIMAHSITAKQGAQQGLELVTKIIIPSLLPILIITSSIVNSSSAKIFDMIFGRMTEAIFKLPRQASSAIIFGLIGGYPAGAILTNNLQKNGLINDEQARRMLRFDFSGGIAFVITAVGTVRLKSTKAGVMLFLCSVLASIIIGIINGLGKRAESQAQLKQERLGFSDSVIYSVEASTKSILTMSSYIILFSAISAILKLPSSLEPLVEITSGVFSKENSIGISELAFYLSFGGLCIHLQIFDIIKSADMKYVDFLAWRIAHASLSYFLGKAYMLIFPTEQSVYSNITSATASFCQYNKTLSIVLLVGCIVLVFDLQSRKSILDKKAAM